MTIRKEWQIEARIEGLKEDIRSHVKWNEIQDIPFVKKRRADFSISVESNVFFVRGVMSEHEAKRLMRMIIKWGPINSVESTFLNPVLAHEAIKYDNGYIEWIERGQRGR